MSILINAYCTHRNPPALDFPHDLNSKHDRSDPEMFKHLNGFIGFIMHQGGGEMTQRIYHLINHIKRVQHQFSMHVEEDNLDEFANWAWSANAICLMPDGCICDPSLYELFVPGGQGPEEAEMPYPQDALVRKDRTVKDLKKLGIKLPETLPPVISEVEVHMREEKSVAMRALALFTVALRAETLATNEELSVEELRERLPLAFEGHTPKENDFLCLSSPAEQDIINNVWRYEAISVLQWALGFIDELPFPDNICDVPKLAKIMLDRSDKEFVENASLRPASEILDALDLHYRLHWAARQAGIENQEAPAGLDSGVLQERHYALNWLVRFENANWDDVDTPT